MYPIKKLFLIILLIVVFPVFVQAMEIRAFVDKTHIILDESVHLTVSINGEKAGVDVSGIRDFTVIPGGTSTSVRIINSSVSRVITYNYTLIPSKEGRLVIPPLTVEKDGQVYHTKEIIVDVSKNPQNDTGLNDIFVEADVSNPNPCEGQQIIYTFKLYSAVQIANAKFQKPDFSDFIAKAVEGNRSYHSVIAGRDYAVTEVVYVLIPLKAGNIKIEPAILTCNAVGRSNRRSGFPSGSFFDDPFFGLGGRQLESRHFKTPGLTVTVKLLPPYAEKVKYSGLVGKFKVKAEIEDKNLEVGDSTTLKIMIDGTGNIMDTEEPEVKVPEAFKVYADNPEEDIHMGPDGFSGKKIFRFALVPLKQGSYEIEPIHLSYFDTSRGEYEIISTQSILLKINPSSEKGGETDKLNPFSATETGNKPFLKKQKVEFTGRDILPLKEDPDALKNRNEFSMLRFIIFLLAPVFLYFSVRASLLFMREKDDPASIMSQRAINALKKAGSSDASKEEFFTWLYRALVSSILSIAGVTGESLTCVEGSGIAGKDRIGKL
ncbi:MAG: protein BatD [Deltaproteobacteria bacterium]|nr:protein BatD [Deltaproteobacteria bacterium]